MLDRTRNDDIDTKSEEAERLCASPSDQEVIEALERIIASSEFRASPHLAAFLRFSVEKSLAGEGPNIKAYSVATGVLGRPPTFDPQADPIVRVEATRLRRAMERYYLHDGVDDPIRIDIPRGRYIAFFSYRDDKSEPAHATAVEQPIDDLKTIGLQNRSALHLTRHVFQQFSKSERRSIAVIALGLMAAVMTWGVVPLWEMPNKPVEQALALQPIAPLQADHEDSIVTGATDAPPQRLVFANLQLNPFDSYSASSEHHDLSHRLTHMIAERASEFEGIPVFDPDGPMPSDPSDDHLYALMGTILQDSAHPDRIEISVRLVERPSYEIVWAKSYEIEKGVSLFDEKLIAIRDDIVHSTAGLNGAIRVDDARRHVDDKMNTAPCQLCLAESDIALRMRDPKRITKAISCLTALVEKRPNEALIFKQLAALRLIDAQKPSDRLASIASAKRDLETAISLAPADMVTRKQLERLRADDRLQQNP